MTDEPEKDNFGNSTAPASLVGRLVRPLIWYNWPEDRKIPYNIPLGELLLVEIKYRKEDREPEIKSARFTKNSSGSIFGIVGDAFWFDRKIIRWASIQHLIEV